MSHSSFELVRRAEEERCMEKMIAYSGVIN